MPLQYLSDFWETLKNTSHKLWSSVTWSDSSVIEDTNSNSKLAITFAQFRVLVLKWFSKDHSKLLQPEKTRIKITAYWNKYHSRVTTKHQNLYLDYSINSNFLGENRLFMLPLIDNSRKGEEYSIVSSNSWYYRL